MDDGCGMQSALHQSFGLGSGHLLQHQILSIGEFDTTCSLERIDKPSERHSKLSGKTADWDGFFSMADPDLANQSCDRTMPVNIHSECYSDDVAVDFCPWDRRRKQNATVNFTLRTQSNISPIREEESLDVGGGLCLQLCPPSFNQRDDVVNDTRSTKRFCPASQGIQSPMCRVDDCNMDLKHAKDYHRRHKVCEHHAKALCALVHRVMQRFCQQCSRFHPLQEFDDDKRSCRRRLAGHNKRRRKYNLDSGTNNLSQRTDMLAIISILSQLQAAKMKGKLDTSNIMEGPILQGLMQADLNSALSSLLARDIVVAASQNLQTLHGQQAPDQGSLGSLGGLSQAALILLLRDVLAAQIGTTEQKLQQKQVSQQIACQDQNKPYVARVPDTSHKAPHGNVGTLPSGFSRMPFFSELQGTEISNRQHGPKRDWGNAVSCTQESDLESPPNSTGRRSPTEWNFFPSETGIGLRSDGASKDVYDAVTCPLRDSTNRASKQECVTRLAAGNSSHWPSDSSETRSDDSPEASSSGSEELSGRIIFKLCDPSSVMNISNEHQSLLQEWLSIKPGWIEWYLRPGCILLTVFLSMPARSWKELLTDLPGSLKRLVELSDSDMWTKGRILVQVRQQRALIIDGKVKKLRWSQWSKGPVLLSVRPLAVLAGEETTLAVHGYSFVPHTKIVCVYHGRYVLHEVPTSACKNTLDVCLSDSAEQVHKVRFPGGPPNVIGRCFIEVENDVHGNILPVIVADKAICREISSLEDELNLHSPWHIGDKSNSFLGRNKQADIIRFLHDLGWIFQSTGSGTIITSALDASLSRFTDLLMFAISRNWCAVVQKLLDFLFLIGNKRMDEVMLILSEVNLVHQAVKRKCKSMVELLLHYVPEGGSESGSHRVFTPVMSGPAGLTPLHVAASIHDAEDIIDALTNDPNEVGLWGWCIPDDAGRTPEWHARNSGNVAYLHLVERKQMIKMASSVCVDVTTNPSQTKIREDGLSRTRIGALAQQQALSTELPAFSRSGPYTAQVCRKCRRASNLHPFRCLRADSRLHRHLMTMMVAVAALCAVVTLFSKTRPHLDYISYSLEWESIMYGPL